MIEAYGPYSASATGGNGFARDFLAGVSAMYSVPCERFPFFGPSSLTNARHQSTVTFRDTRLSIRPRFSRASPSLSPSPYTSSTGRGRRSARTPSLRKSWLVTSGRGMSGGVQRWRRCQARRWHEEKGVGRDLYIRWKFLQLEQRLGGVPIWRLRFGVVVSVSNKAEPDYCAINVVYGSRGTDKANQNLDAGEKL